MDKIEVDLSKLDRIINESNNEVYTVKGKLMSISKKKRIYDQNGNKVEKISINTQGNLVLFL